MPIEFSNLYGGVFNNLNSMTRVNKVLSNVYYTSILLSIIIVLIILLIYPCKKNTSVLTLFKIFLYFVLTNVAVLSVHHNFVKNDYKNRYLNDNVSTIMQNIHGGNSYLEEKVKVEPHINVMEEAVEEHEVERTFSLSDELTKLESRI